ncbi:Mu transposase C-terminal domain-containing protein [Paenibacillus sp. GP183]|uniref:Mu transposase C-terminal domain-containing protein n=1 Tax=Paenibacillus sp. GP183 TaxID=1882751 RepID=UPI00111548B5|nr:Mu transposase C-terminal domain-containing protein [Paenibacillus sp. GP183]
MPPVREYAEQLGLSFRIRTDKEIDWVFQSNLQFLEDYLLEENVEVPQDMRQKIMDIVNEKQGISLKELINRFGGQSDSVYKLIVLDDIYIDLCQERLTEWEYVRVYTNEIIANVHAKLRYCHKTEGKFTGAVDIKAGNKVQWDGRAWTILNHGETTTILLGESNEQLPLTNEVFIDLIKSGDIQNLRADFKEEDELLSEILSTAGPMDLEKAIRRFNIVFPLINCEMSVEDSGIPSRTLRGWISDYKKGEEVHGNGFIGLLPDSKSQGNRTPRLSEETKALIDVYIEEEYETSTNKKMKTVWRALKEKCAEKKIHCPSYQTFCEHVKLRPLYEQTKKREGFKAANNHKPFYFELEQTTPRHGERPFQIGHIDHTELDLDLRCPKTGKSLGKAWITFLVDAFTRRILAFYLSFNPPSYRSCMMVIRECVKRHGRLPRNLVVDGGKEFASVYFDTLLALYKINKKERKGQPRFGSVIERLFGVTNEMLIHNLLGNTQVMKNVRQVTPDVNPKGKSVWTLSELTQLMALWTYEVYDTKDHIALGESPRDAHLHGMAQSGQREFTMIPYNEDFKMLTLPTTRNKTAKVYVGRGIKLNYIYYYSPALRQADVENTQVPVRYDPFNVGIAYAFVKGRWTQLRSEQYMTFINRTEKEIQIITEELKKRTSNTVKAGDSITASKIAAFLNSSEGKQITLMQHLKDLESRQAQMVLDGKPATEPVNSQVSKEQNIETHSMVENHANKGTTIRQPSKPKLRENPTYIAYGELS